MIVSIAAITGRETEVTDRTTGGTDGTIGKAIVVTARTIGPIVKPIVVTVLAIDRITAATDWTIASTTAQTVSRTVNSISKTASIDGTKFATTSDVILRACRPTVEDTGERAAGRTPPRTLMVLQRDPLYVIGSGSFIDEMLGAVGAEAEWLAQGDAARFMNDAALRMQG